jgi:heptosyltransferase III
MLAKYDINKVLIYRLGSLGDTVIALPCFHLIARKFPQAERRVLTTVIADTKASAISTILENSGLVHGYMDYPTGLRNIHGLLELRARIRNWNPDLLVYLAEPRGQINVVRDVIFFISCGVTKLIGVPYARNLLRPRWLPERNCFEFEGERLARCIRVLGDPLVEEPASWDLCLTDKERENALSMLYGWAGKERFIVCSVDARIRLKDWGENNWINFLYTLSIDAPDLGLVLIGATCEFGRNETARQTWHGPSLNLCGKLTPRESAEILRQAVLFIGHDSGPMHLAAAVGTPCVAIFSARNKPAVWFPFGKGHRVIYHQTACYGCGLDVCTIQQKRCVTSIEVNEVLEATRDILANRRSLNDPTTH